MSFQYAATAGYCPRNSHRPHEMMTVDLKSIYRTLAAIAPRLGISAGVLTTLRAMVACVRPDKSMICFASTATLLRLRSGGSERTIRRHAEQLSEAGILVRNDSPNGKRYAVKNRGTGESVAFGFDLSPMASLAATWSQIAEEIATEESRRKYLRTIILGRLHQLDLLDSGFDTAAVRKVLRRKLTLPQLEAYLSTVVELIENLTSVPCPTEAPDATSHEEDTDACPLASKSAIVTAAGGQNVRHHSRSKTEELESEAACTAASAQPPAEELLRVVEITCTEAMSFAPGRFRDWNDVHDLAWTLAPMIGIDRSVLSQAIATNGASRACTALLVVLQMGDRIRSMGGYFRAVTLGPRQSDFDVWTVLRKLAASSCYFKGDM